MRASLKRSFSEAPAQTAARAAGSRLIRNKRRPEGAISRTVPNRLQHLLRGVPQRVIFIAALRERRDAAGERPAIGGEIQHRPGAPASRPPRTPLVPLDAHSPL